MNYVTERERTEDVMDALQDLERRCRFWCWENEGQFEDEVEPILNDVRGMIVRQDSMRRTLEAIAHRLHDVLGEADGDNAQSEGSERSEECWECGVRRPQGLCGCHIKSDTCPIYGSVPTHRYHRTSNEVSVFCDRCGQPEDHPIHQTRSERERKLRERAEAAEWELTLVDQALDAASGKDAIWPDTPRARHILAIADKCDAAEANWSHEVDNLCDRIRTLEVALREVKERASSLIHAQPGVAIQSVYYIGKEFHKIAREALAYQSEADPAGDRHDDWMGSKRMPEAQSVNTTTADKLKDRGHR